VLLTIGDFNLAFLDLIDQVDGLKWSGNCNELNAAYSADGTASGASRTKLIKATLESQAPSAVLLRHLGMVHQHGLQQGWRVECCRWNCWVVLRICKALLNELTSGRSRPHRRRPVNHSTEIRCTNSPHPWHRRLYSTSFLL
jgi:hypothetical protein